MIAPCKDCGKRQLNCHGNCKAYAEFVKEREGIRKMQALDSMRRIKRNRK